MDLYTFYGFTFVVLLVCSAAAVVPTLKIGLAGTCNAQRTGRNVLGDSRTGSRKRTVAQLDRRNEVGIAADEAVVTDLGAVLVIAVVVDNDRAAAEVDALADGRVTDIGQVRNLGAVADGGLLPALRSRRCGSRHRPRSAGGYKANGPTVVLLPTVDS